MEADSTSDASGHGLLVVLALVAAARRAPRPRRRRPRRRRLRGIAGRQRAPSASDDLVIVGRIVTMDDPPIAEALLIEDGTVAAVGTRDEVLALAGDEVPVIDIGENVAYPGFIDAHAHWIGDRDYYGIETPAEAMDAALSRGWTSITEQWVNPERLDELEALAADDALPLRVDAYLALNEPRRRRPLRRLVRRPQAGARDGPPPRPGPEDHAGQRLGNDLPLGAGGPDRHHRPGERGGLAGLRPHRQHRGARDGPRRLRGGARPDRTEPAPPPDRPRHPGDRRAARPDGRHGCRRR